jgi:hypothetical protein
MPIDAHRPPREQMSQKTRKKTRTPTTLKNKDTHHYKKNKNKDTHPSANFLLDIAAI